MNGEVFLIGVGRQVRERQHCDRGLVGQRQRRACRRDLVRTEARAPRAHGAGDVLERLLAYILEDEIGPGRASARRRRPTGRSCRARRVPPAAPRRSRRRQEDRPMRSAIRRVSDSAPAGSMTCRWIAAAQHTASTTPARTRRETRRRVLTSRPRCAGDRGVDHVALDCLEARERTFLVGSHQPRIACHNPLPRSTGASAPCR
jgi:hypothetical protein